MNESSEIVDDARAADRLTVAEFEARVATGMLVDDERVELLGGQLVGMAPKGPRHEAIKAALLARWYRACPAGHMIAPEMSFRLSEDTVVEPDIVVYGEEPGLAGLGGESVELVVEIAEASLDFDLGRKARLYASFGVRELWVVDAAQGRITTFRQPAVDGYREVAEPGGDEKIVPLFAPFDFALAIDELQID